MLTLDARIAANRRRTRMLVLVVGVVLLPVGLIVGEYLTFLAGLLLVSASPDEMGGALLPVAGGVGVACTLVLTAVQYRTARAVVLRALRGAPADGRRHGRAVETLHAVALGVGLPALPLRVVDRPEPNSWAVGLRPRDAVVVVTQGMLDLLTRDELEAVLAHELVHVRNGDMRLHTLLGAADRLAMLPARMVTGIVRALFRVHPLLGAGCLAYVGAMVLGMVASVGVLVTDAPGSGAAVAGVAAVPLFGFVGAPLIVRAARRLVAANVEALADAEAWRQTLTPEALGTALAKVAAATSPGGSAGAVVGAFVDPARGAQERLTAVQDANPTVSARRLADAAAAGRLHVSKQALGPSREGETPAPVARLADPAPGSGRLHVDAWLSDGPDANAFGYTARLRAGSSVRILGREDAYVAVETAEGRRGFVPASALGDSQ